MWFLPKQFFSLLVLWKCSLVPEGIGLFAQDKMFVGTCRGAHQVPGRLPDTTFEPDTSITEYLDMRLPAEARGSSGGGLENIVVILLISFDSRPQGVPEGAPCASRIPEDRVDVVRD